MAPVTLPVLQVPPRFGVVATCNPPFKLAKNGDVATSCPLPLASVRVMVKTELVPLIMGVVPNPNPIVGTTFTGRVTFAVVALLPLAVVKAEPIVTVFAVPLTAVEVTSTMIVQLLVEPAVPTKAPRV